jgi:5-deoxy-glucuronate isomerase
MCDDPAHTWVRGTWENLPSDPRLPLGSTTSSADRPVSSEDPS